MKSRPNFRRISPCHCSTSEGWREDQHTPRQPAHDQFFEDDTRLNRLTQSDFVAQKRAPAQPPQDGARRTELMLEQFDIAQPGQAQQLVKPGDHRQARSLKRQTKIAPVRERRGFFEQGSIFGAERD